jgi:hypothetical protein
MQYLISGTTENKNNSNDEKNIDLKTCCVASSSDQQETKEALKRSLANWVYLCATVQQALKAGEGETFRNSRQRPLYLKTNNGYGVWNNKKKKIGVSLTFLRTYLNKYTVTLTMQL